MSLRYRETLNRENLNAAFMSKIDDNNILGSIYTASNIRGGSLTSAGNLDVSLNATISGTLNVAGTSTFTGAVELQNTLTVTNSINSEVKLTGGNSTLNLNRLSSAYDNNILFSTNGTSYWKMWQDNNQNLMIRDISLAKDIITFKDNTGMVGIGTTDPSWQLTVSNPIGGDATYTSGILVENTASTAGEAVIGFKNSSTGSNFWAIGLNENDSLDIAYGTTYTNANTFVSISSVGDIGIGNCAPEYKLDVSGTARFTGNTLIQGTATAPTPPPETNNTQLATTEYTTTAISNHDVNSLSHQDIRINAADFTTTSISTHNVNSFSHQDIRDDAIDFTVISVSDHNVNSLSHEDIRAEINTIETQTIESYNSVYDIPSTAKRGNLDVKLKGMSAVNLVKNGGNFVNTTGWSAFQSALSVEGGKLKVTATIADYAAQALQYIDVISDHKYFIKCITTDGTIPGKLIDPIYLDSDTGYIYTAFFDSTLQLTVSGNPINIDDYYYLNEIKVIDLTSLFGAENEPTLEECDLMFANYIDGLQGASNIKVISSSGKNLLNLVDGTTTANGITVISQNGEITVNGTSTGQVRISLIGAIEYGDNGAAIKDLGYIIDNMKADAKYTLKSDYLSGTTTNTPLITVLNVNNQAALQTLVGTIGTNQIKDSKCYGFYLQINQTDAVFDNYKFTPQLEESTEVNYKTHDDELITLNRLPDGVYDEITKDGKSIKRVGEKTLIASDFDSFYAGSTNVDLVRISKSLLLNYKYISSSVGTNGSTYTRDFMADYGAGDLGSAFTFDNIKYLNMMTSTIHNDYVDIIVQKGKYATLEDARAALAGTKIIYELAQPEILDTNITPLIVEPNGHIFIKSDGTQPGVELNYSNNLYAVVDKIIEAQKLQQKIPTSPTFKDIIADSFRIGDCIIIHNTGTKSLDFNFI